MDFKEIKNIWEASFKNEEQYNPKQLEAFLRIKRESNTTLQKVIANYRINLLIGILMYLLMMIALFMMVDLQGGILIGLVITIIMGVPYYLSARSYLRIRRTQISAKQIRPALTQIIREMERNLNIGTGSIYKFIIIPFALLFGMFIGLYIGSGERSLIQTIYELENRSIIKMILVFVVGSAVTIPVSQMMIRRFYKHHLDDLKSCLKELEENENN